VLEDDVEWVVDVGDVAVDEDNDEDAGSGGVGGVLLMTAVGAHPGRAERVRVG